LAYYVKFSNLKNGQLTQSSDFPPISVIICARNESKNLQNHLPSILNLDYPTYEVVVVNDCSYDDSKEVLESFEKQYPHLKVTTLDEEVVYQHDKKFALTIGIKAAKYEHLVFTDADCKPKSDKWLKEIVKCYTPSINMVLGYGAYKKEAVFINRLIRFDTFFIALQYFSATLKGSPYMGVGRNLSYLKSLFFKNKGFAHHAHLRSGDDDLFVNQVAQAKNTAICFNKESHTVSIPKDNFADWFEQKRRHITTAPHYKFEDKVYIGLQALSALFFYALFFLLIILAIYPWVVVSIFMIRILIQFIIFNKAMDKLDEKDLIYWYPVFDLILTLIYPLLTISNTFTEEPRWK